MADDDAYEEIKVRGDFTEYDRELQRRQSADPRATIGSATFGTEGLPGVRRSAEAQAFTTPLTAQGASNPLTGPGQGSSAQERLDAAINRLAGVLEAGGGGLGGGGSGGGGWGSGGVPPGMGGPMGPFNFSPGMRNNPWVTAIPPRGSMGSTYVSGATIGGIPFGPQAPPWLSNPWASVVGVPNQMTGVGAWTSGLGSATVGDEEYGPTGPMLGPDRGDMSLWYNRIRPAMSRAWAVGSRRLPISSRFAFAAIYGIREFQHARRSISQGEFEFGIADTDAEGLQQLNQGIQSASSGMGGAVASLGLDALGIGPAAFNSFTMGEVGRIKYLDRAQAAMQSTIVTRRQVGAMDLGGVSQKMEEAKLDRDIETARNNQTVSNLKSAQSRLEATASSPEAFAVLDVLGQSIKAQQSVNPMIEAQYQARMRQLGRDTRTQGITYAGRAMLALNTLRGGGSQAGAWMELDTKQAAEMSSAGFMERLALGPVHALERAALAKEQKFETNDVNFDLETREVRARMHAKGDDEEDVRRYEFARKQEFEMQQVVRNNPQNAMALQAAQKEERSEFEQYIDITSRYKTEQRALIGGRTARSLDRSTEVLTEYNPYLRQKAAAEARYADESEALSARTDISQTQKRQIEDAMERRKTAELAALDRDYVYYQKQTGLSFETRGKILDAQFARDPIGAQAYQIAGGARAEAIRFRQMNEEGYAQQALMQGVRQEQLLKRNYLEAFRAEQINLNEISPTNPRDVENPSDVLKRISTVMDDILAKIPSAD